MKDRVREAVFNLIGPAVRGKLAIDLFAGTGALALEALSRGAAHALIVERHFPAADVIRRNVAALELTSRADVISADAFHWASRAPIGTASPWLVFVSPPYEFFVSRRTEMLDLIRNFDTKAPRNSVLVVEADNRFDMTLLPAADEWDVRRYAPAVIGLKVI